MPDLPKRRLGRTDLQVTALGYGAMELRGRDREVTDADAAAILNAVLDAGINYIDTSIDYGVSEERIGNAIAHRRAEYYLASKCGCLVGPQAAQASGRAPHVFTAENVKAGVEQSLQRMKTDYLDVVQFHASPTPAELRENGALDALLELQQQGKVHHIGMSGTLPNLPEQIGMGVFDVFQIPYSALQREHENLIHEAAAAGAGVVVRGGIARGDPVKQKGNLWDIWQEASLDDLLGDMTRMEFMLRFTISHPDMATTIVGTVSRDHLQENVRASQRGPLPEEIYTVAKSRLAAAGSAPA
jgi:aryl-alcohol dehydrogenase-like predicted oxidoreductase